MRYLAILVVVAGCSKGDDCQRLVDKMWPMLEAMAKDTGKGKMPGGKDAFVEECRKDDKMKNDPIMKCVLDASGDDAVKACMTKAFGDYAGKSKSTEAKIMLNKLQKNLKVFFVTNSEFPKGKAGPTPSEPCCTGPNAKCPVVDWSKDPVWSALDFRIDEPTRFQYSYDSDGKTVKLTAVGDVACDGHPVTYTSEGTAANGNPSFTMTE